MSYSKIQSHCFAHDDVMIRSHAKINLYTQNTATRRAGAAPGGDAHCRRRPSPRPQGGRGGGGGSRPAAPGLPLAALRPRPTPPACPMGPFRPGQNRQQRSSWGGTAETPGVAAASGWLDSRAPAHGLAVPVAHACAPPRPFRHSPRPLRQRPQPPPAMRKPPLPAPFDP